MWQSIFDPQNSFWRAIGKFADVLMLSVAWLFLSLPVFTLGAATAGLYNAAYKCVLKGENGTLAHFWDTFKAEFKTSTLCTLLWGGLCALLIWGVWTVRAQVVFEGVTAAVLLAVWFAVLLIPVGCLCWMFPLLSRFTFSVGGLIATSLKLTIACFPRTFVVVALALAAVILSDWLWLPMLVLPCLVAMGWSAMMEPVFKRYM